MLLLVVVQYLGKIIIITAIIGLLLLNFMA
jgi:hypothetical protein